MALEGRMAEKGRVDLGLFRILRRGPSRQMMDLEVKKMANGKGPLAKYQAGGICVALWENEARINGVARTMLKATIERRYKDTNGTWQSSNSYGMNDLAKIKWCLDQAFTAMLHEKSTAANGVEEESVD